MLAITLLSPAVGWVKPPAQTSVVSNKPSQIRPQLVSEYACPDPHVFHDGHDWYIFGTGSELFFLQGRTLTPKDMRKVPYQADLSAFPMRVENIWGFTVFRHSDGSYHAYATLHIGQFRTLLVHLLPEPGQSWTPGRPITRWRFDKLLLGDLSRKDWKYYESKIYADTDGSLWLLYTATQEKDNFILAQRLLHPGELDRKEPPRVLLKPEGLRSEDRNEPGSMQLVEGASLFFYQGKYILFYSVGDFALPNYKLGVAFSDRLIPEPGKTYQKVYAADLQRIWRNPKSAREVHYVLQSQYKDWPNYSGDWVLGPGLGSVVMLENKPWLIFHGYKALDARRRPDRRFVFKLPLEIQISGSTPTGEWVRVISAEEP